MSFIDFLIENKKRNEKYFLNYKDYGLKIKKIAMKILSDDSTRVLIFGSVPKGTWIPNKSDIDVLVISEKIKSKVHWQSELKTQIFAELGDQFAPFEIHTVTPENYQDWYSRFISKTPSLKYKEIQKCSN
jgi:uncharacterized protein